MGANSNDGYHTSVAERSASGQRCTAHVAANLQHQEYARYHRLYKPNSCLQETAQRNIKRPPQDLWQTKVEWVCDAHSQAAHDPLGTARSTSHRDPDCVGLPGCVPDQSGSAERNAASAPSLSVFSIEAQKVCPLWTGLHVLMACTR